MARGNCAAIAAAAVVVAVVCIAGALTIANGKSFVAHAARQFSISACIRQAYLGPPPYEHDPHWLRFSAAFSSPWNQRTPEIARGVSGAIMPLNSEEFSLLPLD